MYYASGGVLKIVLNFLGPSKVRTTEEELAMQFMNFHNCSDDLTFLGAIRMYNVL